MLNRVLLVLGLCLALLALVASAEIGTRDRPRIVGGSRATAGQFPFLVFVDMGYGYCSGTLISLEWIVCAAHCFYGEPTPYNITVYAGSQAPYNESLESVPSARQVSYTSKVIIHPKYTDYTTGYDVALIKLEPKLIRTDYVAPMVMANSSTFNPDDTDFTSYVAGYGVTEDSSDTQVLARYVDVAYISAKDCNKLDAYKGEIISGQMICAGGVAGKDSCQGDSGGPLFWTNDVSDFFADATSTLQIGITSWGQGCAEADTPGVYSDVVNMALGWVSKKVQFDASVAQPVCGDGVVSGTEECENSLDGDCCGPTSCKYYAAGEQCGDPIKYGRRLGTCKSKYRECKANHKCAVTFIADGGSCPYNKTTTGTCMNQVCSP